MQRNLIAVAVLDAPVSLAAQPAAAVVRRVFPLQLEQIERPLLRECLEALYRASGAADANDLSLVGVYDRVPWERSRGRPRPRRASSSGCRPG